MIACKNRSSGQVPGFICSWCRQHFLSEDTTKRLFFRIPIYQRLDFPDVVSQIPEDWTICFVESENAALPQNSPAIPYYDADFTRPTLMVFGSEARGLSNELRESVTSTHKVVNTYIPHASQLDSLNVGMAATVLIFEMVRFTLS